MPSGQRIRANNVYGTISNNPLLAAGTSFTSLGLNLLPAITTEHAVLVFDPKREFGEPEIVVVTSHLALGTSATITRAAYGTVARDHPQGTAWAHVPVGPDDYTAIVTSGTRPSDPYFGQVIFESDTNSWVGRNAGNSAWANINMYADPPAVSVAGSVTANNNTLTVVAAPSEFYDTDNMHDTVVDNSRLTINTAGIYLLTAHVIWTTDTDITEVLSRFLLNGAADLGQARLSAAGGISGVQQQLISSQARLSVSDFVEVQVRQVNTSAGSNSVTLNRFAATWIGRG